jgi:hypothetical protein
VRPFRVVSCAAIHTTDVLGVKLKSKSPLRIVLGNRTLARYPQGGGHWTVRLQYLLGLEALGHDVFLLELLESSGDAIRDHQLISSFFTRLQHYGLSDRCALLLFDKNSRLSNLEAAVPYGKSRQQIKEIIQSADLLWNYCCQVRQPMLGMFRHRVLIDLDPGHLQVSALTWDMDLYDHQAFLSVGKKLLDADCEVPTFGLKWYTFTPFVYLPMWEMVPDPGQEAPFSSITHWTWGEELWLQDRVLSTSKRDAYLRYIELPQRAKRPFELAANILPADQTGDRELLESHGWKLVDPWEVAGSPSAYQRYIARSRAEISCPKPVFKELQTGWFSDRSACYLATGRPVIAEDTGIADYLPIGTGLLVFHDISEAVTGVVEIDSNYQEHMRAARALAEEFLDSRRCLEAMLAASG